LEADSGDRPNEDSRVGAIQRGSAIGNAVLRECLGIAGRMSVEKADPCTGREIWVSELILEKLIGEGRGYRDHAHRVVREHIVPSPPCRYRNGLVGVVVPPVEEADPDLGL